MTFPVTFVSASQLHLGKTYTAEGAERPPHAKSLTSIEYNIAPNREGLEQLAELVSMHTGAGDAFFTGRFREQLINESRAGRTDTRFKPQVLVVDIDGLPTDLQFKRPIDDDQLTRAVAEVRKVLPTELADVSCVAHASSSFGMKPGEISMHLFFILEKPFSAGQMKTWLTACNFSDELIDHIQLNPSAMSLHFPLDRCTGENTRLIYIAAPRFDGSLLQDPFERPIDRVCVVDGDRDTTDVSTALGKVHVGQVEELVKAHVKLLRDEAGFAKKTAKLKTVEVKRGEFREVLTNPDPVTIEIAYERDPFVYANLNGGDSNGYYWIKEHPKYIYNFKDEPVIEMAKAAPEFYRQLLQDLRLEYQVDESVQPLVVRDRESDVYLGILYDGEDKTLVESNRIQRGAIEDFLTQYGGVNPDYIETWTVRFDPHTTQQLNFDDRELNTFYPTAFMELQRNEDKPHSVYGEASIPLQKQCPGIHTLLLHALGDGVAELEHFINWLAFVFTRREKTSTAWILHGVEGTGKGVFFHNVLKPLFGRYAVSKKMANLEDNFNAWRESNLLAVFDEFRMADAKEGSRTYDNLKNMISEPTGTIRGIHANQRDVPLFDNFLFFSNSQDALRLGATDRRFTVPPAQEVPIINLHDMAQLTAKIDQELTDFAQFLIDFNVDEEMARTVLETEAKRVMRLASNTWVEDFASSVRGGDFEWFVENIAMLDIYNPERRVIHQKACEALARIALDCLANGTNWSPMSVSDLHFMYIAVNGSETSITSFAKTMARLGINFERKRHNGKRDRYVEVEWDLGDTSPMEFIHSFGSPKQRENVPQAH